MSTTERFDASVTTTMEILDLLSRESSDGAGCGHIGFRQRAPLIAEHAELRVERIRVQPH